MEDKKLMDNKKNIIIGCIAAVLVIAIVVTVFVVFGKKNSSEKESSQLDYLVPLDNYFGGIKEKNIDKLLSAFPEFMNMSSNITSSDIDDLYTSYESVYGANIQIDYSYGEAVALSEDEIEELETEIEEAYSDAGDIDITAGYTVSVTVKITGDGLATTDESTESTETTDDSATEESTESTDETATEEDATDEESTEDTEETTDSDDGTEEDEMYVLQYNGNWYVM